MKMCHSRKFYDVVCFGCINIYLCVVGNLRCNAILIRPSKINLLNRAQAGTSFRCGKRQKILFVIVCVLIFQENTPWIVTPLLICQIIVHVGHTSVNISLVAASSCSLIVCECIIIILASYNKVSTILFRSHS